MGTGIVLSTTNRDYLRHLAQCQADGRTCWVVIKPRNRWGLLVWTPTRRAWAKYPKFTKNGRTLARLEAAGLIEYGQDEYLPVPYQLEFGSTVVVTDAGLDAIASKDNG